jgi:hypothetical protein
VKRVLYFLCLGLIALHLYHTPNYDMDMIGYMGNALLYRTQNVGALHRRVYAEVRTWPNANALTGDSGHEEQDTSRKARAEHAEYFAEFLPCFAIRPAYNTLLFLLSPIGLTRAAILISVLSYFFIGWLMFAWTHRPLLSLLVMLTPPLVSLGRSPVSDAFALLLAFSALALIFEKEHLLPGLILLLGALFARTDYIFLAAPVLVALWWLGKINWWQVAVLSVLVVLVVLSINHFAGDYGVQMLYYRNFVRQPIAPAEVTVHFSRQQYFAAFRSGLMNLLNSAFVPFAILGVIGFRSNRTLPIIALVYAALHYVALPNFQERWFVISYLLWAVPAFTASSGKQSQPSVWLQRGRGQRIWTGQLGRETAVPVE